MEVKETSKFLTINKAAEMMCVSRQTIYAWINNGYIKPIRTPGGRIRIPEDQLIVTGLESNEEIKSAGFAERSISDMEPNLREQMAGQTDTPTEMQMVVLDLGSEYYGVDISNVREIIRMQTITRVLGAPPYVEGIINIRGQVIPVVDLRKRLELTVGEQTSVSRIVLVTINGKDIGVIVDAVIEVLCIPRSSIEPVSSMVSSIESDYLRGIAKLESRLIILLDLGKVLAMMDSQLIASLQPTE